VIEALGSVAVAAIVLGIAAALAFAANEARRAFVVAPAAVGRVAGDSGLAAIISRRILHAVGKAGFAARSAGTAFAREAGDALGIAGTPASAAIRNVSAELVLAAVFGRGVAVTP
jgi:hypothetical protein